MTERINRGDRSISVNPVYVDVYLQQDGNTYRNMRDKAYYRNMNNTKTRTQTTSSVPSISPKQMTIPFQYFPNVGMSNPPTNVVTRSVPIYFPQRNVDETSYQITASHPRRNVRLPPPQAENREVDEAEAEEAGEEHGVNVEPMEEAVVQNGVNGQSFRVPVGSYQNAPHRPIPPYSFIAPPPPPPPPPPYEEEEAPPSPSFPPPDVPVEDGVNGPVNAGVNHAAVNGPGDGQPAPEGQPAPGVEMVPLGESGEDQHVNGVSPSGAAAPAEPGGPPPPPPPGVVVPVSTGLPKGKVKVEKKSAPANPRFSSPEEEMAYYLQHPDERPKGGYKRKKKPAVKVEVKEEPKEEKKTSEPKDLMTALREKLKAKFGKANEEQEDHGGYDSDEPAAEAGNGWIRGRKRRRYGYYY